MSVKVMSMPTYDFSDGTWVSVEDLAWEDWKHQFVAARVAQIQREQAADPPFVYPLPDGAKLFHGYPSVSAWLAHWFK